MNHQVYIARREKRMKQEEVAELIGIHKQTYHLKERGKRDFTITEGKRLCVIFDKTLDELFN